MQTIKLHILNFTVSTSTVNYQVLSQLSHMHTTKAAATASTSSTWSPRKAPNVIGESLEEQTNGKYTKKNDK